jgi:hypothetical protein
MTETTNSAGEPECTIFIAYVADLEVWHAVWSNQDGYIADFDGQSEEEVVAWARERCDELWLRRPGDEDYARLTPSG